MNYLFTLFLLLTGSLLVAQGELHFSVERDVPYEQLSGGTVITASPPLGFWDTEFLYETELPKPVTLYGRDDVFTHIEISGRGVVTLLNEDDDVYSLAPFAMEFIDKRIGDEGDSSDILLSYTDTSFVVEYRNVASLFEFGWVGFVNSVFNIRLEVTYETGNASFHYGPISYRDDLWELQHMIASENPAVGIEMEVDDSYNLWLLSGVSDNPELEIYTTLPDDKVLLDSLPREGLRYHFDWYEQQISSTDQAIGAIPVSVYPNPVADVLYWQTAHIWSAQATLQLLDARGVIVGEVSPATGHVALDQLPSGIYYLRIQDGEQSFTEKILKH